MLKKINGRMDMKGAEISIKEAQYPTPFEPGLEYNMPARGHWNIVHTAMLVPGLHQIYACARGCLRGVILTAGEMMEMERMSFVTLEENDYFNGRIEDEITEGVTHILEQLEEKKKLPPAVMVVLSCIQLFAGIDFPDILEKLRQRFPEVDFIDGYMHPTMRKSGLTPDQVMRRQIYDALKEDTPIEEKSVSFIGNDHAFMETADHVKMLEENSFTVRDLPLCKTYEEYLALAKSSLFITNIPPGRHAGEALQKRLGRKTLHLPVTYSYREIRHNLTRLAEELKITPPAEEEFRKMEEKADQALQKAKEIIGNTAVSIDHTATFRPLGMARLLLEKGFHVTRIHADAFTGEEKEDFFFLKENHPSLMIASTVNAKMRFAGKGVNKGEEKILAIGQGAAYFARTPYFVNMIADASLFGFDGIIRLAEKMVESFETPQNTEQIIQIKGLGCGSCLL